jgi:hypothetical protein
MDGIELLRCLPDDTYLVLGRDRDGPTAVWLRRDGTVKAGLTSSQLGEGAALAGVFRGDPVIFGERELTVRVVGPDLVANGISGLKLEKDSAYVMELDADTLILSKGPGLKGELYSIKKKEKK